GRSTISTVLGVQEGLEVAQERAEEAAKAAFVTWLNGKVTVRKTSANQLIIVKEGEEGTGNDGVREQAKMVEKRTREFQETASSLVRGLKLVASETKGKEKTYTVVYRWEPHTAGAVEKLDSSINKS